MGQMILGTGNYAKIPYFLEKIYVNVYSLEELCYCLVENAELLDNDIVNGNLVRFLDEQCGLSELAHALYALMNQKGAAHAFVSTILEYAGLYPSEEIMRVESIIKSSAGLSPYEKQKAKADYLLQNKRYSAAIERYSELLVRLPAEEKGLRGRILHNLGVIHARLFLFERAQAEFLEAYQISGSRDSLEQFLTAQRLRDNNRDYVNYIAEHPELHEVSMQVEHNIERATEAFDATEENRMLFTLRVYKEEGSITAGNAAYYDEIETLTEKMKDAYRESVAR
ncbi:MAG: hypothetical protein NC318_02445 [Blautia sp.]|nr:hypothetical protein [Lachnoclostridium sp.]MCM1210441.1 hypothetical protein [Blautia sp.]